MVDVFRHNINEQRVFDGARFKRYINKGLYLKNDYKLSFTKILTLRLPRTGLFKERQFLVITLLNLST